MNIQDITISHDKNAPMCVSPVYASFFRLLNDNLNDTKRQELKQYIPQLLNTKATPSIELKRMYFLVNATVKVFAVDALKKAGLTTEANELLALQDITNEKTARAAARAARVAARVAMAVVRAARDVWAAAEAASAAAEASRKVWAAAEVATAVAQAADKAAVMVAKADAEAAASEAAWAAAAALRDDMTSIHNVINQLLEIKR